MNNFCELLLQNLRDPQWKQKEKKNKQTNKKYQQQNIPISSYILSETKQKQIPEKSYLHIVILPEGRIFMKFKALDRRSCKGSIIISLTYVPNCRRMKIFSQCRFKKIGRTLNRRHNIWGRFLEAESASDCAFRLRNEWHCCTKWSLGSEIRV